MHGIIPRMKSAVKFTLAALGCAGLAGVVLWWFANHRRGIAWAVSVVRDRFPDVSHLSPSGLDAWLHDTHRSAPQIVDARSEDEFAVSHLPGARRIDPESTAATALGLLDPERPVVIYCSAGYRGATLARRLRGIGRHDVWNLEGGIFAWANADLPLERDGQPAQRVHPYLRIFSRLLKPRKGGSSSR
jgi:rhodanese-related sulfurtransferase